MVTHAGLQRPAQDRRGAAGVPRLRLRDDRAGQGAADHPVAHPPLPVPADPADDAARPAGEDLRRRGRHRRADRVPAGRPGRRRLGARLAVDPRPAAGRRRAGGRHLRDAPSGCSASPTTRCSTRPSTRWPPHDAPAVFGAVDRVVEAGHDPRRFATDLLDRLRDLIVLDAVPDAGGNGLLDTPPDRLDLMSQQAQALGSATLSRMADTVHAGLTEMRGTTAPRLLLELVCARMLLPATDGSAAAHAAAARAARTPDVDRRRAPRPSGRRGPVREAAPSARRPSASRRRERPAPGRPRRRPPRPPRRRTARDAGAAHRSTSGPRSAPRHPLPAPRPRRRRPRRPRTTGPRRSSPARAAASRPRHRPPAAERSPTGEPDIPLPAGADRRRGLAAPRQPRRRPSGRGPHRRGRERDRPPPRPGRPPSPPRRRAVASRRRSCRPTPSRLPTAS